MSSEMERALYVAHEQQDSDDDWDQPLVPDGTILLYNEAACAEKVAAARASAIAAALEVAEGHRCCIVWDSEAAATSSPVDSGHPLTCECLHPCDDCAAAIAAELKRLM